MPRVPTSCEHSQTLLPKRMAFLQIFHSSVNALCIESQCTHHYVSRNPPREMVCVRIQHAQATTNNHIALPLAEIKHGLREYTNENGHKPRRSCSCCSWWSSCSSCSSFSRCSRCSGFNCLSMISLVIFAVLVFPCSCLLLIFARPMVSAFAFPCIFIHILPHIHPFTTCCGSKRHHKHAV